jgi:hypothetical protein
MGEKIGMENYDLYSFILILLLFAWRVKLIIEVNTLFVKYKYIDKSIGYLEPDKIEKKPHFNKIVLQKIRMINNLRIITFVSVFLIILFEILLKVLI